MPDADKPRFTFGQTVFIASIGIFRPHPSVYEGKYLRHDSRDKPTHSWVTVLKIARRATGIEPITEHDALVRNEDLFADEDGAAERTVMLMGQEIYKAQLRLDAFQQLKGK